jgi:hypothetical protein
MGFWGTFIVHRGQSLLEELLPGVDAFHHAQLCFDGVNGDWQVTRVFAGLADLPSDLLPRLRDATAAAVLAADVLDSDAALVVGLGAQAEWRTWLQLDRAIGYFELPPAPFDEDDNYLGPDWTDPTYEARAQACKQRLLAETHSGRAAADAAISWAQAASLHPSSAEDIAQTLERNEVFVEDLLFILLNKLGLATDQVQAPTPPAPVHVLRDRLQHRLMAIDLVPHQPTKGERLVHAGLADLRLSFDGMPDVTACACLGGMFFRPDPPTDAAGVAVSVDLPTWPLTDAATIRQGMSLELKGIALRFGDTELYLAFSRGSWLAAEGAQDFQDQLGSDDDGRLNAWISAL